MVAFLDCLSQFIGLILKSDGHLKFPYEMKDGVLKDANSCSSYSIKYVTCSLPLLCRRLLYF